MQPPNVRNQTLAYLDYMGFQCARWLPAPDMSRRLRPINEIAGRLAALAGLFAWASAPKEVMPNSFIAEYFKKNSTRQVSHQRRSGHCLAVPHPGS